MGAFYFVIWKKIVTRPKFICDQIVNYNRYITINPALPNGTLCFKHTCHHSCHLSLAVLEVLFGFFPRMVKNKMNPTVQYYPTERQACKKHHGLCSSTLLSLCDLWLLPKIKVTMKINVLNDTGHWVIPNRVIKDTKVLKYCLT